MDHKEFDDIQSRISTLEGKAKAGTLTNENFCQLLQLMEVLELGMEETIERCKEVEPEQVEVGSILLKALQESRTRAIQQRKQK